MSSAPRLTMLRTVYRNRHRNMSKAEGHCGGPQARLNRLRKLVTNLFRYERIEDHHFYLDEARGYAELIILEAQKHGDKHQPTMEMLDYWLLEKDMIHKLFKEYVPRYKDLDKPATFLHHLPLKYPGKRTAQGVLEMRDNPLPPLKVYYPKVKNNILNVLLDEVRKEESEGLRLKKEELYNSTQEVKMEEPRRESSV